MDRISVVVEDFGDLLVVEYREADTRCPTGKWERAADARDLGKNIFVCAEACFVGFGRDFFTWTTESPDSGVSTHCFLHNLASAFPTALQELGK